MRKNKNNNQKNSNNNNHHQRDKNLKNNNNSGQSQQQQQQQSTNNNPNFKNHRRSSGQNQINSNNIINNNNIANKNSAKNNSKRYSGPDSDQNLSNLIEQIGDKSNVNNNKNNIVKKRHKTVESGDGDRIGGKKRNAAVNGLMDSMKSLNPKILNRNQRERERERTERGQLVLWRRPLLTISYCSLEIIELTRVLGRKLLQRKAWLAMFVILLAGLSILYQTPGSHQVLFEFLQRNTWFVIYWIGLGILSSVGLGTGLHTFIMYLGPHIASVTLAAYECNSLHFPKPPYPDDIICPEEPYVKQLPNIWSIMSKVRLEAFLWGAGTALGELPPYFMAKAARLSGYDPEDAEELAEFEALKAKRNAGNLSLVDRGKLFMERVVERIGFLGILACASIPNPLFDLAGITCGHFLVPFWTFFGATLIGKAIIKMHIQKVFVIIAFNESLIEKAVDLLGLMPFIGKQLQEPFKGFLNNQKKRLHRHRNTNATDSGNLLSKIFEMFVICMVCYFIVSIINSLAQSYHKRLHKKYSSTTNLPKMILSKRESGYSNMINSVRKHKKIPHKE